VLQGWSKSNLSGRLLGLAFILALGFAANWGVRTLFGIAR
jgi:hypothetical protein